MLAFVIAASGGGGANYGLLFFTWITFGLLVVLLGKLGWTPIMETIRSREEKIQDDLSSAEEQREKAERLLNERKEELDEAHDEAREIIEDARSKAEQLGDEIEQEARQKADSMVESAEQTIEAERKQALQSVRGEVGNLAINLAEKILRKDIDETDHEQMVDEFVDQLDDEAVSTT